MALAVALVEGFAGLTAVEGFLCVAGFAETAGFAAFELELELVVAANAGPPANSATAANVARMFFIQTPPFVTD